MIINYRDKRTRDFAAGKWVKAFSSIERATRLNIDRLEAATALRDLAALPGNRFEVLKGDRKGQYSIRINDQWRICFEWPKGRPDPTMWRLLIIIRRIAMADPHLSRRTSRRRTEGTRYERCRTSRKLKVPTNRITGILNGQRAITGDTALRLAHFFGTSAEFWLNLQKLYELRLAEQKAGKTIKALPTLKSEHVHT